ncbi:MAG: hypothetical protein GEV12_15660 [Micromonosporaceae bacterium]|nr:hypothetical protein [Micromonosporaceae bacterium]
MTRVLLNLAMLAGMLLVVPLGLRLVDRLPAWTRRAWLAGAAPAVVSLWLPRGALACRAADLPHPPVDWMVATHGVANAFGFAVCGMLAWWRIAREPR